jgi:G:T/U-mismatch repair DNA glycosylase
MQRPVEILESGLTVVFVETAVVEPSDVLGFHHLHPRDRFWEALELGGITPVRIITPEERKALAQGHAQGSLSEPIRVMFIEKKTSQLTRLGIGLAQLNRRVVALGDKDRVARPTREDIDLFMENVTQAKPRLLAFVTPPEVLAELIDRPPSAGPLTPGRQAETIAGAEVWFLGSTIALIRGDARTRQENAFFELGERISALKEGAAST